MEAVEKTVGVSNALFDLAAPPVCARVHLGKINGYESCSPDRKRIPLLLPFVDSSLRCSSMDLAD
jgi:hypothetical protein